MSEGILPYQDAGLAIKDRVDDLLTRMSVEDKAGLMFQPMAIVSDDLNEPGMFDSPSMQKYIDRGITHVNILQAPSARKIAQWYNKVQAEALKRPLGIPFTISSDPRHSFSNNPMMSLMSGPFSQWPEFLGFGALDDPELTGRFADIVRKEYLAVGIRTALHPQLDLATEPRWARANGTFGESADVVSRLGTAYLRGLQTEELGPNSVSAMAKHFPGGGPQKDGEDPHFNYGREQVYPGGQFELHLKPFRDAIAAGVSQIMPYYGMPVGIGYEEVGFSFNKRIITELLRGELGFDGIVCTDWGILTNTFWGVESLTYRERMIKALNAGIDQFGGEFRPQVLAELVHQGLVDEERLDVSVRRLLREKFRLGLFDHPFVDEDAADSLVGTADAVEAGYKAQVASQTLLVNKEGVVHLPLSGQPKVYVEGMEPAALAGWANVVASPEDADVAIVRTNAPWEPRGVPGDMEFFFHAGSLNFHEEELAHLRDLASKAPLIVDVYLDRPAILAPIVEIASVLTVNYGACDEAFAEILFGSSEPKGRLPMQIPSSMEAVQSSRPDVPSDTANPTFPFGFGLSFEDFHPAQRPEAQTTTVSADAPTFRYDLSVTPLKTLLADPEARAIIVEIVPELPSHPMIALAEGMPFETVVGFVVGQMPDEIVTTLRTRLGSLPLI